MENLSEKDQVYLDQFCLEIPERCVGSAGNLKATEIFAAHLENCGFAVEMDEFSCFDWQENGASLQCGGESFEVFSSPYSLGCKISAPLCIVSDINELRSVDGQGKIVLIKGNLAQEQLMPKNFPFYNPDEHQEIVKLLESGGFAAVVAATGKNPEIAGGVYPFPLIEDGDFILPAAYMKDIEGERLAQYDGEKVELTINADRKASRGFNVIGRKGSSEAPRIVLMAHLDSKKGTPGALDNAGGAVTLLLLAGLLRKYQGDWQIEIAAINGEDYYSVPGEMLYLQRNENRFSDIFLGINIDGAGYIKGKTAYSLYDCPPELAEKVGLAFAGSPGMAEGKSWYQGDHGLFLQNRRPALAITSELMDEVLNFAHTPDDTPDKIDTGKLTELAGALEKLVMNLTW